MVGQVTVISILMIVQGALALIMGLFMTVAGFAMIAVARVDTGPKRPEDEMMITILSIFYLVFGPAVLLSAALNLMGGIRCLKFRGRTMAIVALFSNVIPVFTFYCAPTSLAVMIYGLIVMFNRDVARAFEMADEGMSPQEIQRAFARW